MFKDIKLVFNQIYFQTEKLPLILLIISLIVKIKVVWFMKNFLINNCTKYIEKNTHYDKTKLAEIKYGLESIYLSICVGSMI